jgi:hypothetical protein
LPNKYQTIRKNKYKRTSLFWHSIGDEGKKFCSNVNLVGSAFGAMTLSIMTLSIMKLSIMTLSIMKLSIMTLSKKTFSITINKTRQSA